MTPCLAESSVQANTGRTARDLSQGEKYGKTALRPRLLARLDLHSPRVDLSFPHCSEHDSALPGRSWRQCHLLLEFPSRCRAVFPAGDCELVPDSKALSEFAALPEYDPTGGSERVGMNARAYTFGSPSGERSTATTRSMLQQVCKKSWTLPSRAPILSLILGTAVAGPVTRKRDSLITGPVAQRARSQPPHGDDRPRRMHSRRDCAHASSPGDRNQSYREEVFLGDGMSSPAALFNRLSQVSHSSIVHCPLRQSYSQRAESSGTS